MPILKPTSTTDLYVDLALPQRRAQPFVVPCICARRSWPHERAIPRRRPPRCSSGPGRAQARTGQLLRDLVQRAAYVDIHRIAVPVELSDGTTAVSRAIDIRLPAGTAPSRCGHYWIDISRAWLLHGDRQRALDALQPRAESLHSSPDITRRCTKRSVRSRHAMSDPQAAWPVSPHGAESATDTMETMNEHGSPVLYAIPCGPRHQQIGGPDPRRRLGRLRDRVTERPPGHRHRRARAQDRPHGTQPVKGTGRPRCTSAGRRDDRRAGHL